MIAIDTNILAYAYNSADPRHGLARDRIETLAATGRPWGLPLQCALEFVRLATHAQVLNQPLPAVLAIVDALVTDGGARLLVPPADIWRGLSESLADARASGNLVFDALVVATCRAHGVTDIASEDRDLTRFRGIRVVRLQDDWRAWTR